MQVYLLPRAIEKRSTPQARMFRDHSPLPQEFFLLLLDRPTVQVGLARLRSARSGGTNLLPLLQLVLLRYRQEGQTAARRDHQDTVSSILLRKSRSKAIHLSKSRPAIRLNLTATITERRRKMRRISATREWILRWVWAHHCRHHHQHTVIRIPTQQ